MRALKILYLNLSFYAAFLAVSGLVIPAMTAGVILISALRGKRVLMRNFRNAIIVYGKVVTRLGYPLVTFEFQNRTGIDDLAKGGPYLFICNHRSSSDPFLVSVLPVNCELVQVVNQWPFRLPVLGFFATLAGYLNVNAMPFERFRDDCMKLLAERVSIVFFPEGTRSGGTHMNQFHSSAFKLFLEGSTPIIPMCISGNEDMPHKGTLKLLPGRVRIRLLPPLMPADFGPEANAYKVKTAVRAMIERELGDLDAMGRDGAHAELHEAAR